MQLTPYMYNVLPCPVLMACLSSAVTQDLKGQPVHGPSSNTQTYVLQLLCMNTYKFACLSFQGCKASIPCMYIQCPSWLPSMYVGSSHLCGVIVKPLSNLCGMRVSTPYQCMEEGHACRFIGVHMVVVTYCQLCKLFECIQDSLHAAMCVCTYVA